MGTKRRSGKRKRLPVLEDYDQDGVPNFDDCRPLDPTQHGLWDYVPTPVKKVAKRVVRTVVKPVKRVVRTVVKPVKRVVRTVVKPVKKVAKRVVRKTVKPAKKTVKQVKKSVTQVHKEVQKRIVPVLPSLGRRVVTPSIDMGREVGRDIKTQLTRIGIDIQRQAPKKQRPSQDTILFGGFVGSGERVGRLTVAPTPQRMRLDVPTQRVVIPTAPTLISAITSLPSQVAKEVSEHYTWMRATPSERATIAMIPSVKAQTEAFAKGVETYETKWKPHIESGYFVGTKAQYAQQTREHKKLQRGQAQLEKQYGTFTGLEARTLREKKEAYWGLPAAYGREQERAAKWTKERVPSMKDVPVTWFERDKEWKKMFQEAAIKQPDVFTPEQLANIQEPYKPPELPMWAERIFRGEQFVVDYQKGMIEGVREKPFETIATTAAFAAMPPVMKGLKKIGEVTRIAPATKIVEPWVPTIGKMGKISYPTLKRGAAMKVGVPKGILPPVTRYIPTIAGIGMGGAYVGSLGHELYSAKAGERISTLGRMTSTEIMPMVAGTYIGYKYTPKIAGLIYTAGKKKIPLTEIGVEKGYPFHRDISAKALEKSFMRSTLIQPPEVFHAAGRKIVPMEPIPKSAILPGEAPGGFYAWEAVPFVKPKIRMVMPGSSELPAEYYAPIYEAYFSKVQAGITPKFSLFGITAPDVSFPSAIRTRAWGLREIPALVRAKGKKAMASFIETEAEKGVFYMPLMKGEYEAVLPMGTQIQRVGYKYYTTVEGVRVPIHQVEAVLGDVLGKDVMAIGKARIKYGGEYYDKAIPFVTPTRLGYAEVSRSLRDIAYTPYQRKVSYYPQLPSFMPSYYDGYVPKLHMPKTYDLPKYKTTKYKEHTYPHMPREYMMPAYEYDMPTYKPRKYKTPKYEYDTPIYGISKFQYDVHTHKAPKYKYKAHEYTFRAPKYLHIGVKIPEYEIPGYEYKIPPIRDAKVQILEHEVKKRKYKKKYRFEEVPWREKHYIPTLKELMRVPESMKVSQPKAFVMKMPKIPKGLF